MHVACEESGSDLPSSLQLVGSTQPYGRSTTTDGVQIYIRSALNLPVFALFLITGEWYWEVVFESGIDVILILRALSHSDYAPGS